MALASANAVSPAPAVDNAVKATASAASTGSGTGGTFTDSLEAVLAPQGASDSGKDDGTHLVMLDKGKLAKLKNKLKSGDADIVLSPQQLQQQQAFFQKLRAGNSGIDIPALRAAMSKSGQLPGKNTTPVLNPVTGKIDAAHPAGSSDPAAAGTVPPNSSDAANVTPDTKTAQANPAKTAAHAASQKKLAAALMKAAQAPVLKAGQDDGSKVPNAKIAHAKNTQKSSPSNDATDADSIAALGAKIAATAGVNNAPDTAHIAARSVAVAEVTAQKTVAAPTVTKLETAAMANATQVATHQPAAQAKVEAQALPVQFDAASASAKDGNAGSQSGQNSNGDKNPAHSGNARLASDAPKLPDSPANNISEPQQPAPPTSTHTTVAANASTMSGNGSTALATPVQTTHIATTLQVSQQPQNDPAPDQTTFAALGVAIAARSKDGEKQFDINMHPADLGRVDVRISVDSDGKAQAHLSAEHPQTLQLLQNDKATLERNLRDAGLDLSNNGLNFSLKGEQQPSTPTFNTRSRALSIAAVQTPDSVSSNSHASIAPGDSRLDIRV